MDKNITKNFLAPAKINIRLEVLHKKPDGYHEIRSIMCSVGLYDVVTLSRSNNGIHISTNNIHIPVDKNNLAYQAADLLLQKTKTPKGAQIHLKKNIPVASGLGGGSSDAAAVMKGINDLYELKYSQRELMKLGAQIGADVPFFFSQSPALATGTGEKILPLTLFPPFWTLLTTPPIPVSTAWAYGKYNLKGRGRLIDFSGKINLLTTGKQVLHNDLENVVIRHFPEIREIKIILEKLGSWGSLMSGSGPTVFGIFFSEREVRRAEARLVKDFGNKRWAISVAKALL